jgi:hypothetical protein
LRLIERTIDRQARQCPLAADYELKADDDTLPHKFTMQDIIDLYKDHATHEQGPFSSRPHGLGAFASGKLTHQLLVCTMAAGDEHLAPDWPECTLGEDAPQNFAQAH